jgi:hypothetical protein
MFVSSLAAALFATAIPSSQDDHDVLVNRAREVMSRTEAYYGPINELKKKAEEQEAQLERLKSGKVDKNIRETRVPTDEKFPIRFPSQAAKQAAVEQVEQALKKTNTDLSNYKERPEFYYGILNYPPKEGDFGRVYPGEPSVNVAQVIDGTTMLVRVYYGGGMTPRVGANGRYSGFQRVEPSEIVLMVKGVSTAGATDGKGFPLPQVFEVSGTEKYKTAIGGSNTVFVVKPLDTEKVETYIRSQSKTKSAERPVRASAKKPGQG